MTEQSRQNVESIVQLEKQALYNRSMAERVAERVTSAAGSTPFVIFHIAWYGLWIAANLVKIHGIPSFDPFPFSFLTLVVSLEAIFLTLLVLMSQKRMMKDADKRTHLDLQLNMLAEQEATEILRMVRMIGQHLGVEEHEEKRIRELERPTNVDQLAETIDRNLPK